MTVNMTRSEIELRRSLQAWDNQLAGQQVEIRQQLGPRARHLEGELRRIQTAAADPMSDGPLWSTIQGRGGDIDALLVRLDAINDTRARLLAIMTGTE